MPTKLYVGNLSPDATAESLERLFAGHGEVRSVELITDRDTGKPKGFAFVAMNDNQGARDARAALNGLEIDGRHLTVNDAQARKEHINAGRRSGRRY